MSIKSMTFKSVVTASALAFALSIVPATRSQASGGSHGHWSYKGEAGPEHWGSISHEYAVCAEGRSQSPIDISGAKEAALADIAFSYKPSGINVINNGHTIQANYDEGSSIEIGGARYSLLQFHFHDPSEHTVDGKPMAMEVHLVHKNAKGELAVVGVLIKEGRKNDALASIWKNLPKKADEKKTLKGAINAEEILPKDRSYYNYSGSLTTPPCSEGVNWLVLKTPIEMSKKQIKKFQKIVHANARPVQPLGERTINAKP